MCNLQLSLVRWEGNKFAHIIAQNVRRLDIFVTWVEEDPVIIKSVLLKMSWIYLYFNKVISLFINKKKKIVTG